MRRRPFLKRFGVGSRGSGLSDPQYETLPPPDMSLKLSGVAVVGGRSTYSCGS